MSVWLNDMLFVLAVVTLDVFSMCLVLTTRRFGLGPSKTHDRATFCTAMAITPSRPWAALVAFGSRSSTLSYCSITLCHVCLNSNQQKGAFFPPATCSSLLMGLGVGV